MTIWPYSDFIQSILAMPKRGGDLVYNAVVAEEHLPDEHDGGHGDHHRAEEEGAELALEGGILASSSMASPSPGQPPAAPPGAEVAVFLAASRESGVLEEGDEVVQEHELRVYRTSDDG